MDLSKSDREWLQDEFNSIFTALLVFCIVILVGLAAIIWKIVL